MISVRDRAAIESFPRIAQNVMNYIPENCGTCGADLIRCTCGWLGCYCEPEAREAQCEGRLFSCPWCGTRNLRK